MLAAAVLIVAVGAGFLIIEVTQGNSGNSAIPPIGSFGNVTQASLNTAVAGLCEVRAEIQTNQPAARATFYDKSHLFLHQLAAEVQDKDVNQATSLLIAKYQVEALLPADSSTPVAATTATTSPDGLVSDLIAQVQQSAAVLGFTAPNCS